MTAQEILAGLDLPAGARLDQRVPKKLLVENGAPTTADKRLINDGIEEIHWLAALKPATIGVMDYRDEVREYLEIAVLSVTLRAEINTPAKTRRLAELVHRAVPYPVFLIVACGTLYHLSLAHKRWAQNEAGKVVLEEGYPQIAQIAQIGADKNSEYFHLRLSAQSVDKAFLEGLALNNQPRTSLYALYQGWIETFQALHAARRTGAFAVAATPEQAAARGLALQECQRLEADIARLRSTVAKEKQLARQVELNLALKRLQAQLAAAREQL